MNSEFLDFCVVHAVGEEPPHVGGTVGMRKGTVRAWETGRTAWTVGSHFHTVDPGRPANGPSRGFSP